jgi:hypothetical protein
VDRIECPSCGAVTSLPPMQRTAEEFCASCDFPLFWARRDEEPGPSEEETAEERAHAAVVRRRPGAAGRQVLVGESCPVCSELNTPDAVFCHRCGADMRPAPPPLPTPAAPEEPAAPDQVPVAESSAPPLWLVAAVGVLAALLTVQLMVLFLKIG